MEKDTFFTRFTGCDSKENEAAVGVDICVSGVHARELTDSEGEWQLEPHELTDNGRIFLTTDSSAAATRAAAFEKCFWAC